jgi:hypothetical protein
MREGILDSRQPLSSLQLCTSLLHQICSTHRLNCGGVCAIRNRPVPRHRCPADAMQRQRDEQRQPNKRHAPCPLPRRPASPEHRRQGTLSKISCLIKGFGEKRETKKFKREKQKGARIGSRWLAHQPHPRASPRKREMFSRTHFRPPFASDRAGCGHRRERCAPRRVASSRHAAPD